MQAVSSLTALTSLELWGCSKVMDERMLNSRPDAAECQNAASPPALPDTEGGTRVRLT
jgi:hypothetical protein